MLACAALPPAAAQPRRAARPAAPVRSMAASAPAIQAGPMLGYSTHREALVWVQTTGPARVQLRYALDPSSLPDSLRRVALVGPPVTTAPVEATAANGYTAHVVVAGLEPGRAYAYTVLLDGRPAPRPYPTRFRTQPLWQWRTDPPAFTVAFGSCNYVNEPAYDRPGRPYGSDHAIFGSIARLAPEAMLWLGDNTYLREVDWWTEAGMDHRYRHTRSLPELQPLLAATNHYATWDDHDYGPNDADRAWVHKGTARGVFARYWGNLSYGLPDVPGVFGQFEVGDAAFFLLDDRTHRAPNALADTTKPFWGDAQLTWLLDALTTSRAPFKIVVNGGQVLNPVRVFENASTYPVERRRLLDELARRRISGVVFLSGDRHHTDLQRLDRPGMPPLYDFTSSALTAGTARPSAAERDNPARVPGTLVDDRHSFGTLAFAGPRTDRTLTMRAHGVDGGVLWTHTVRARDLAFAPSGE